MAESAVCLSRGWEGESKGRRREKRRGIKMELEKEERERRRRGAGRRGGRNEGRRKKRDMDNEPRLGMGEDQDQDWFEKGVHFARDWTEFLSGKGVGITCAGQLWQPMVPAAASSFLFPRRYWPMTK